MVKKKGKNAKPKEAAQSPAASEAASVQEDIDRSGASSQASGDSGQGPSGRNQGRGGPGEEKGRGRGYQGEGRGRGRGAAAGGGQPSHPGAGSEEQLRSGYEQQKPQQPQQPTGPWAGRGVPQGPPQYQQGPLQGPPPGFARAPWGPPQGQQGPPQHQQGPPQHQQGPPQYQQGPPQGQQGPPQHQQGPPQYQQGPPQHQQGPPQYQQGPPQGQQGAPQQQQGPPQRQPGAKGPGKKGQQQQSVPASGGAPVPATSEGPTPAEGPRSFQATSPKVSQEAIPSEAAAAGDQKLISMKKGLGDMSISGNANGKKTAGVQSKVLQIPHRKSLTSCGHSGRHCKILTNHLALNLASLAKTTVYHYDVTIDPDKPKRLMRRALEAAKKEMFPTRCPAFDGKKNLYSAGPLVMKGGGKAEVKVFDDERERTKDYVVTIKYAAQIDMSSLTNYMKTSQQVPQTAIQALDVILRTAPAFKMVQVGRSFFSAPQGQIFDLGNGLEVWHGVFQSAIIGWKPYVNIDVAHKGFPKAQNCVALIGDLAEKFGRPPDLQQGLNNFERDSLMKFLRELKVNYQVPNDPTSKRTYRVNGIGLSARDQRFKMDDGTEMSVAQYYAQCKKYPLRFPNLPVLDVGSPTRAKKIYIPLELCMVKAGQVVIKKMNELQTSNMIKVAATPSDDRKRKIMDAMKSIDFNNDPCVSKEFNLSVAKEFEVVDSRVLDPPSLMYARNQTVHPRKGVWFAGPFLEGMELTRWTILNLARTQPHELQEFSRQIQEQGRKAGMKIAPPAEPFRQQMLGRRPVDDVRSLEGLFQEYKDKNMQIVFCVVEERGDSYAQVKRMAELTIGVLTQCIKAVTIQKRMRSPATADNILMKVNSKLNGKNHSFTVQSRPKCLSVPTMIVGADVTHPPPDQTTTPSVAAVCASHDPKAFQYNLQYRLQPPREEIITDLQAIMKEQLMFFFRKNRLKPQRIIFYRDGVSEGQFNEVLDKEFQAIRRACSSLQADYQPGITFLVVQKRHHTRFFPDPNNPNPMDHDGRNNNVPAGTIVDTMITHPTDMDFYLVSHASIQGTSRPTKYRRLWDDNDIPEDELELLTYYLCHMFSRCSRSVSYPAPTYNAHLAAYRVRCYLETGQGFAINKLQDEQERRKIQDCILKDFPMFFV